MLFYISRCAVLYSSACYFIDVYMMEVCFEFVLSCI